MENVSQDNSLGENSINYSMTPEVDGKPHKRHIPPPLLLATVAILVIFLGSIFVLGSRTYFAKKTPLEAINPSLLPPQTSSVSGAPTNFPSSLPKPQNSDQTNIPNGWQIYTNTTLGISIRYPSSWLVNSQCEKYGGIFFGYSQETAGKCEIALTPDFKIDVSFGVVSIEKEESSFDQARQELANDPKIKSTFPNIQEITVGGNPAFKTSGVVQDSDNPIFPDGTKFITYIIKTPDGLALNVGYAQQPEWQDHTETFETMVKTIRFL